LGPRVRCSWRVCIFQQKMHIYLISNFVIFLDIRCKTYLGSMLPPVERIWQLINPDYLIFRPVMKASTSLSTTTWKTRTSLQFIIQLLINLFKTWKLLKAWMLNKLAVLWCHIHLRKIDLLMACTTCLVCQVFIVSDCLKKAKNVVLVAGTQHNLSNLFL